MQSYLDFLNHPVDQEYFTKFLDILSFDKNKNPVAVHICQKNSSNKASQNGITFYCDKIKIGETLKLALERSLLTDLGLRLVDYDVLATLIDVTKNKSGKPVSRFPVVAYVEYNELKNCDVVGCKLTWVESNSSFWSVHNPEAKGWLKNHSHTITLGKNKVVTQKNILEFVEHLYSAGALDIRIDDIDRYEESEYIDAAFNPNFLRIRLPKDSNSRVYLFVIYNKGISHNIENNTKVDSGQTTLEYYWS